MERDGEERERERSGQIHFADTQRERERERERTAWDFLKPLTATKSHEGFYCCPHRAPDRG
ncbi:hypothetical protein chiPu_0026583, partial [Chiloscyllium punctatum]|nr:hypothetical protein [Chiloscyllium punctatum]